MAVAQLRRVLRLPDEGKPSCVEDSVRRTPRCGELRGSPAQAVVTEAASVIANIAASPGESSAKVIESGAVPLLIELLRSTSNNDLKDHAALALGNVAIGSAQARDLILESGGLEPLTDVMTDFVGGSATSARVLNSTVWAISQMCRAVSRAPCCSAAHALLPPAHTASLLRCRGRRWRCCAP